MLLHTGALLFVVFSSGILGVAQATAATAGGERSIQAAIQCEQLLNEDFTGIPDAATTIMSTELVAAGRNTVEYCEVKGIIAPQIQFEMRLPTKTWNGRYYQTGCGVFCGFIWMPFPFDTGSSITQNFAQAANNLGHVGHMFKDAVWTSDPMLLEDFSRRATHVTSIVGKEVTKRYYAQKASYTYYHGCSTGGREGLTEAQHFPEDFDGIIAGAPAFSTRQGAIANNWDVHQLFTRQGEPVFTEEKLSLINRAVLKKCDALDGLADGILADPRDCDFNVTTLACPNEKDSPDCLTARQVESVKRLYDGPRNSQGTRLYPGYVTKGGELYWDRSPGGIYSIANNYLKYFAFEEKPPASYTIWDFNFDSDFLKLESRARKYEPVPPFTDPDLTGFSKTGGKLLVYHGWSDAWVSPLPSVDYYAEVAQNAGGVENVHDWYRLFMMPGMKHCRGGDGPDSVDWVNTMVRWVEQGEAPDQVLATQHENSARDVMQRRKPLRTRPVYPYPTRAQYTGKGDVNNAKNWQPVQPGIKHEDDIKWIWDTES